MPSSRHRTTVTRNRTKRGSVADRGRTRVDGVGIRDYDRPLGPVRSAGGHMRIAFLTGIWPPDVGGPATHGPDLARFLTARGHEVHVVTMGDGEPTERPCEVEVVSRHSPFPIRYGQVTLRGIRAGRRADLVYATATYAAAAVASSLARRPLVLKLVSDPAYERAQRYGLFTGSVEEFQTAAGRRLQALKARGRGRFGRLGRSSSRALTSPRSRPSGVCGAIGSTCSRTLRRDRRRSSRRSSSPEPSSSSAG